MALLEIKNLHVALEDGTAIVKGVDLAVDTNEKHAIMGPNGSGKSTLAYALMGHPAYVITEGEILLDGVDVSELGADERAQKGLFLAFQYPHAIPGVTVTSFLRSAINAKRKAANGGEDDPIAVKEFRTDMLAAMEHLKVPRELASRYLNDGFSGGEKKRVEILQMAMLKPRIAVLDERCLLVGREAPRDQPGHVVPQLLDGFALRRGAGGGRRRRSQLHHVVIVVQILARDRVLELPHSLAQLTAHLRQPLGAEDEEQNEQQDEKLGKTDSKWHRNTVPPSLWNASQSPAWVSRARPVPGGSGYHRPDGGIALASSDPSPFRRGLTRWHCFRSRIST